MYIWHNIALTVITHTHLCIHPHIFLEHLTHCPYPANSTPFCIIGLPLGFVNGNQMSPLSKGQNLGLQITKCEVTGKLIPQLVANDYKVLVVTLFNFSSLKCPTSQLKNLESANVVVVTMLIGSVTFHCQTKRHSILQLI